MTSNQCDTKGESVGGQGGAGKALQLVTLTCPADPRYRVELDHREAFPNDPGAGTVAMVYGPRNTSGTWGCVSDTGVLNEGEANGHDLPPAVVRWMDSIEDQVDAYTNAAFEQAGAQ